MAGRPHQLLAGTPFFQKLAESVKIDPRQVGLQPRGQPGMRRLCFSSHSSRSPVGCRMIIRRLNKYDVGVEREEAAKHLAKQAYVASSGKAVTVEGDFNLHATHQMALCKALCRAVIHVEDGFQTPTIHLAVGPFIQRQGAAQDFSVVHQGKKTAAQMAQHPPVKAVLGRGVARQRWCAEVTHRDAGGSGFHHRIEHGALQRTTRQLAVSSGEGQRQAFIFRYGMIVKGFPADDKPGVVQPGGPRRTRV